MVLRSALIDWLISNNRFRSAGCWSYAHRIHTISMWHVFYRASYMPDFKYCCQSSSWKLATISEFKCVIQRISSSDQTSFFQYSRHIDIDVRSMSKFWNCFRIHFGQILWLCRPSENPFDCDHRLYDSVCSHTGITSTPDQCAAREGEGLPKHITSKITELKQLILYSQAANKAHKFFKGTELEKLPIDESQDDLDTAKLTMSDFSEYHSTPNHFLCSPIQVICHLQPVVERGMPCSSVW